VVVISTLFIASLFPVIPAQAGIQGNKATSPVTLDPRLRGDDGVLGDGKVSSGEVCAWA